MLYQFFAAHRCILRFNIPTPHIYYRAVWSLRVHQSVVHTIIEHANELNSISVPDTKIIEVSRVAITV